MRPLRGTCCVPDSANVRPHRTRLFGTPIRDARRWLEDRLHTSNKGGRQNRRNLHADRSIYGFTSRRYSMASHGSHAPGFMVGSVLKRTISRTSVLVLHGKQRSVGLVGLARRCLRSNRTPSRAVRAQHQRREENRRSCSRPLGEQCSHLLNSVGSELREA